MAAAKPTTKVAKNKLGNVVTPRGSALFVSYPRVSQFDENKYEASIILSGEDHEKLLADLNARMDASEEPLVVAKDKIKYPFKDAVDKEGNPTGEFIWKAKTNVKYPPKLYDGSGKMFVPSPDFNIPNRSVIRLAVGAEVVNTSLYKGLVLRLNSIAVVSASPWQGVNPFAGIEDSGDFTYSEGMTMGTSTTDDSDLDDDWN